MSTATESSAGTTAASGASETCWDLVVVRFAWPVDGLDPIDGDQFRSDRHRVAAARAHQDPTDTTFISSQGEIVARWDTSAIISILWPNAQVFDPPAPETRPAQQTAPPQANNPVGSREWLDDVKRRHPRAYAPWSADEDSELARELESGLPIREMANRHQRRTSAISSRLQKLGLR